MDTPAVAFFARPVGAWAFGHYGDRIGRKTCITICFAQVPESIAFAYMAHVKAPVALHAAWEIGLVCGIFGGRPGMVNGATGAFAAIISTLVDLTGACERIFKSPIPLVYTRHTSRFLTAFLTTEFGGGRHAGRVEKLSQPAL